MKVEFGSIDAQQKSIDSLLVLKSDATIEEQGAALQAHAERLGATEGAASARITGAEGTTTRVSVTFDGNAISTEARGLVNRLKDVPEPPGARAYFGGESAVYDDTLDALGETLPSMLLYMR